MERLTLKQAMYLSWFLAVTRKVALSSGEGKEGDFDDPHAQNLANLYLLLKDEKWTNLNISRKEQIEISEQSNFIYVNKGDEVGWAADNMYISREELEGVGSLVAPPVKFKTNLFEGQNFLKSFPND
jgi:hypothetical protein